METLDLDDIQGLVAAGFGKLRAATYLLLEISEPDAARDWLGSISERITPSRPRADEHALNIALTPSGLLKLGLPEDRLALFPNEFLSGMTTLHRRRILGDVGANAPEGWDWGGPATPSFDLLLLVFARDREVLSTVCDALSSQFPSSGLTEIKRLETSDLDDREHFGFRDGISQPVVEGIGRTGPPRDTIKAGEFVLGYRNEYGLFPESPTVARSTDRDGMLAAVPGDAVQADFGRNGTYLVFRQLRQDVRGFWRFLDHATKRPDGSSDPEARTRLGAKMVGRWPGGAPLALAPDHDDASLANENDFAYYHQDADGQHCPFGAHVRRSNPRDSLDPAPGTDKSVAINKRHRLLRRGREYGPPLADDDLWRSGGSEEDEGAEPERGLYFICLNASIARQFEFVSHTWGNNPNFAGLYNDPDPITGFHRDGGVFTVPAKPVRQQVTGLPQFVTVRGGAYFFLPGIRAIRYLSGLGRA